MGASLEDFLQVIKYAFYDINCSEDHIFSRLQNLGWPAICARNLGNTQQKVDALNGHDGYKISKKRRIQMENMQYQKAFFLCSLISLHTSNPLSSSSYVVSPPVGCTFIYPKPMSSRKALSAFRPWICGLFMKCGLGKCAPLLPFVLLQRLTMIAF